MVHVQAILFASLVVSLLSAFLAMLGKQWLNRYESTDMRGSAAERSHNRQRKLDGIVAWYFNHVIESLSLMLQAALLLLGCALSRYLWDVSISVTLVVVGLTSFGVVSYLFIVVTGAFFKDCPYQTPGSRILHHLGSKIWNIIHPTATPVPWHRTSLPYPQVRPRAPSSLLRRTYQLARNAGSLLYGTYVAFRQRLRRRTATHLRCISWTLQTSLDKTIHLEALKYLAATELIGLDPALVADCFDVFVGCLSFNDNEAVVVQGLEELARVSAGCFMRTFQCLRAMDPTSSVLADLRRRFHTVFLHRYYAGLPFFYAMHALVAEGNLFNTLVNYWQPSSQEYISLVQHMTEAARVGYQQTRYRKVPRWILRLALDSLFLDPPSPTSVVADCLTIIAIDLECDVPNGFTTLDGRCVSI